jgi:release factor glutamine methyltransferase
MMTRNSKKFEAFLANSYSNGVGHAPLQSRSTPTWAGCLFVSLTFLLPLSKLSAQTQTESPTAVSGVQEVPTLEPQSPLTITRWEAIEDFSEPIAILPTVFWEPLDTVSLRKLMREKRITKSKKILEIGTGSGLIALCAIQYGATSVVATDVNVNAIECAAYNANRLRFIDRLTLRKVEPGNQEAYVSIYKDERFDLIISNPPWEDGVPKKIDDFALYDTNFALLDSLLSKAPEHLLPNGEVYLAYGCKTAIHRMIEWAKQHNWKQEVLDDRKLDDLTEVFLPGMLVRLTPP